MPTVIIADTCKASLVMSSEIVKDKLAGAVVLLARSGKEALELVKSQKPDLCIVDFDLPDSDGISLVSEIRKIYEGAILLTAYPDKIVREAVSEHLFAFADAGSWVSKPIKSDDLGPKIDRFVIENQRVTRRFEADVPVHMIAAKKKAAPKVVGKMLNVSVSGACLKLNLSPKTPLKVSQELTLSLLSAAASETKKEGKTSPTLANKKMKGKKLKTKPVKAVSAPKEKVESQLTVKIAWVNAKKGMAGVSFEKLTEQQKQQLDNLLKKMNQTAG